MRPIQERDAEAIEALEVELFDNSFNATTIRREIRRGEGWVVEEDDRLVGYLLAARDGKMLDVIRLGVRSSHQRRGIGTELLKKVLYHDELMLCVRRENWPAIKIYYREGFRILGHTEDSWVMLRKGHHPDYL